MESIRMLLKLFAAGNFKYLIMITIIIMSGCSSGPSLEDSKTSKVSEARELLDSWSGQSEKLARAKELLDQTLIDEPNNVYALKELGRYIVMDGYISGSVFKPEALKNAENTLLKAVEINPDFDGSYVMLGYVYELMNDIGKAIKMLDKADALNSSDPWLHLNYASIWNKLGMAEKAKSRYQKVVESKTDNTKALSTAYTFLIKEGQKSGDYESVKKYYEKVFEIRPDSAWERGNYANLLLKDLGDYDGAIKYAREALDIRSYGVGRRVLGLSLYGKWDDLLTKGASKEEADAYFAEAFQYYPNLNGAFTSLAARPTTFNAAKRLVEVGASIDGVSRNGWTALARAASDGETELSLKLLKMGANPDIPTKERYTALSLAISYRHTETALALMENGVSPKPSEAFVDPLSIAKLQNDTQVIQEIQRRLNASSE